MSRSPLWPTHPRGDQTTCILLAAVSIALGCGARPTDESSAIVQSAIVQGGDDDVDDAVVAMELGGVVQCSGTLIAADVVVTAAHCVTPTAPDAVLVGAIPTSGARLRVRASRAHPKFDASTLANDDESSLLPRCRRRP